MSKFAKLGIVGGVYALTVIILLFAAMRAAGSRVMRLAMLEGGGSGLFSMYGMAFIGLSIVASVILLLVAKDKE